MSDAAVSNEPSPREHGSSGRSSRGSRRESSSNSSQTKPRAVSVDLDSTSIQDEPQEGSKKSPWDPDNIHVNASGPTQPSFPPREPPATKSGIGPSRPVLQKETGHDTLEAEEGKSEQFESLHVEGEEEEEEPAEGEEEVASDSENGANLPITNRQKVSITAWKIGKSHTASSFAPRSPTHRPVCDDPKKMEYWLPELIDSDEEDSDEEEVMSPTKSP